MSEEIKNNESLEVTPVERKTVEEVQQQTETPKKDLGGDAQAAKNNQKLSKADFVIIGVGQAGGNIAKSLVSKIGIDLRNVILLNMSEADLRTSIALPENRIKFGRTEGAGKNRDLSKSEVKSNPEIFNTLISKYENILVGPNKIIIVAYSTGGGTGSGVGNYLTTYLTQHFQNRQFNSVVEKPHVLGLAILPIIDRNLDSGEKSYQNSLECLQELQNVIDKKLATFALISNDIESDHTNPTDIYQEVNNNVSSAIERFFVSMSVSESNADLQDRLTALDYPGLMSIFSPTKETSFLKPIQADPAKMMICEVASGKTEDFKKYMNQSGISYSEEVISKAEGDDSIGAVFGITAVSKLAEVMKYKLEDSIIRNSKRENVVKEESKGFDSVSTTKNYLNNQTNKQSVDLDSLNDLF